MLARKIMLIDKKIEQHWEAYQRIDEECAEVDKLREELEELAYSCLNPTILYEVNFYSTLSIRLRHVSRMVILLIENPEDFRKMRKSDNKINNVLKMTSHKEINRV